MADLEKWIETAKNRAFYEASEAGGLPHEILTESPTNRYVNVKMARCSCAYEDLVSLFPKKIARYFIGLYSDIITIQRSIDGWSVDKAIQAEGEGVRKEAEKTPSFFQQISGAGGK